MRISSRHLIVVVGGSLMAIVVAWLIRPSAVPVQTAVVDRGTLRVTVDEDGETRVRERYLISAPVTGRMERLECEVGDSIAAGEVVARVYPLPLDTRGRVAALERLSAAEAAGRAALARVEQTEALWGEAVRARERLERVESEVPGTVSAGRLDAVRTAERAAALDLEQARGAADAAAHDVESARAALLGSSGGQAGEPTLIRAPSGGRVLRLYEDCERVVTAGAPIMERGDPELLEVVVDVLSSDARRLREGAVALLSASPDADTVVGRIHRIEPSAFTKLSPLGVEEQRVNVIVRFEDGGTTLGDRYRVDAALVAWEGADVVRVPVSALVRTEGGWAVFVVDDGRASLRGVELGQRGRRAAEVRSGLVAGEVVVLYPSDEIDDGVRVSTTG
jgi:HlyD family secretion protein